MSTDILEKAGLTKNETTIYLTLNHEGPLSIGQLLKQTTITSSRMYASLNTLTTKGIISSFQKNNKTYYVAEKPTIFLHQLEEDKKQLLQFIHSLNKQPKTIPTAFEARIYEGFRGFRTAFNIILDECTKNDEILTIGFSQPPSLHSLRIFLKNIDRKRIEKKIPMRILFDQKMRTTIGRDRQKEAFVSVRYMPQGYCSPAAINIFRDYVLIELWEEQPLVFLMQNKAIANSFQMYFNFLWMMGKE